MGKRVDLSKEIVKKTKITRNLKTTYTHSFYYTNIINEEIDELEEESTEEQEDDNEMTEEEDNLGSETDENNEESDEDTDENNNDSSEEGNNDDYGADGNLRGAKKKRKNRKKVTEIKNNTKKVKKTGKNAKNAKAAASILKNPKVLLILLIVALAALGIIFLISLITSMGGNDSLSFGGMYNAKCSEMTVIFVDPNDGYKVTGSQTYSMEDYVAGVVSAEVGGFANKEVYKTYALAARTYGLTASSDDCTIEGSARRQAFNDISEESGTTVDMIYEAVRETEGQVLIADGQLYSLQYDAFCYIDKDENYYTLSQKNQKIPTSWAKSNVWSEHYLNCPCDLNDENMTECWENGVWQDGGHGNGMSQYGAYYLATELDYTYEEILDYYYGDAGVTISTTSFMTSIAGLEIKDTTNAEKLEQPITEFLSSKGSSLEDLNSFIYDSVIDIGSGTREGVVTAAVSMINYLYDNFNTKLPYYWGGQSEEIGLPTTFGVYSPSSVSRGGSVYYYKSFDCSGFVSWAIKNGGYNFSRITTHGFDSRFGHNSCNITDSNCIGQPGDLINSRTGHVELIVAVDQENGKYFIAHSSGPGVVMTQRNMHSPHGGSDITKIIYMDEFYNNELNVNPSY